MDDDIAYNLRALVETLLVLLGLAHARGVRLVLGRAVKRLTAVEAINRCMTLRVVLVELGLRDNVTTT